MSLVYLDHNATTWLASEVRDVLARHASLFANPSSVYPPGREARALVEEARGEVASFVGAGPEEVTFVASGSEACATALLGTAFLHREPPCHVVVSPIEHAATLAGCQLLRRLGHEVSFVRMGPSGRIDPDDVRRCLRPDTRLVVAMHANNETGVIQPLEALARIAHEAGAALFSDAVQTAGKIPLDLASLGADVIGLSAHKLAGPKGIGAVARRPGRDLVPVIGGSQEMGQRGGTENVLGILGMAAACRRLPRETLLADAERIRGLRDRLCAGLLELGEVRVNGALEHALPGTLNISFRHVKADALATALAFEEILVSTGSACHSRDRKPSHVLAAMEIGEEWIQSAVRFSLAASNTAEEIDRTVEAVARTVHRLRAFSPSARKQA